MKVRLVDERTIRSLIDTRAALEAVTEAFGLLAEGKATAPVPSDLDLVDRGGEMHVKGAYLHGAPFFSYKAATGFYGNAARGLPISNGLNLVFDAENGFPHTILFDNGYLTELRTGAAGALAATLLARKGSRRVGIMGAGGQARYQLEALVDVISEPEVVVFSRSSDRVENYATEMRTRLGIDVRAAATAEEAITGVDVLVTTTPSREPIVMSEWVKPGTHITAVGADLPEKQGARRGPTRSGRQGRGRPTLSMSHVRRDPSRRRFGGP